MRRRYEIKGRKLASSEGLLFMRAATGHLLPSGSGGALVQDSRHPLRCLPDHQCEADRSLEGREVEFPATLQDYEVG